MVISKIAVEVGESEMTIANFYDEVDDVLLRFAVIIATSEGKYVFCNHKARNTWEVPEGHRRSGGNDF